MKSVSCAAALLALVLACACSSGATNASGGAAGPKTEDEKTLYALGLMLGGNVKMFALTPAELEMVRKGITDAATGAEPLVDIQTYGPKVQELARVRQGAAAEQEKQKAVSFEEEAAKEDGAVRLPSGLVYRTLKPGTGVSPAPADVVRVHYEGKLVDGSVFDSSVQRGTPAEFSLNQVIPCWTEGVARMKVGEKAKLVCPSSIAYGDQGRPPVIKGGATLVFEVELLEIKK
jgi:FKBP-type peptidyl-prolyl cis-trans isomerase FkpA